MLVWEHPVTRVKNARQVSFGKAIHTEVGQMSPSKTSKSSTSTGLTKIEPAFATLSAIIEMSSPQIENVGSEISSLCRLC